MSDIILKAENISKQYRLGLIGTGTIAHDLNRFWHRVRGKEDPYLQIGEVNDRSASASSDYVWALKDINFEVKRGEILGIIGKNGAGKSTLLKILSRVTSPTTGSIKTKGRIASLLEVGTGMHPELTGRENIFLNGAILGMNKTEISSKIDEIIEFSGCQMYIDTPVKRYSSGMRVRLGFAVAAFLEPDILVVDEVLAVGDAEFQKKAIGKMQDISNTSGRTVLFVSHDMTAIRKLCNRVIMLHNGTVVLSGETEQVVKSYLSKHDIAKTKEKLNNHVNRVTESSILKMISVQNPNGNVFSNQNCTFKIEFDNSDLISFSIGWLVKDYEENVVSAANMKRIGAEHKIEEQKNCFTLTLEKLPLFPGIYSLSLFLNDGNLDVDIIHDAIYFEVLWPKKDKFEQPPNSWGKTSITFNTEY
jgi:lipopolysaccharide transport system ATP-binding protein